MLIRILKQSVKSVLVSLKHRINRYPAIKRPIMSFLHRFPDLEYRLKMMGRIQPELDSRYIPAFTPDAAKVFEYLTGHQREDKR